MENFIRVDLNLAKLKVLMVVNLNDDVKNSGFSTNVVFMGGWSKLNLWMVFGERMVCQLLDDGRGVNISSYGRRGVDFNCFI